MVDLKGTLSKLGKIFTSKALPNREGVTPEEVELAALKKREYHIQVKKELNKYRKKNNFLDTYDGYKEIGEKPRQILHEKFLFKQPKPKKYPNILDSHTPMSKKNILNTKRVI